jgi:hypothetical protein
MAKAKRKPSKKRQRQPRRELRFTLDEAGPKSKADALRRWLVDERVRMSAAQERNRQLDAARREIDAYIAVRDSQTRPPWVDASRQQTTAIETPTFAVERQEKTARGRTATVDWITGAAKKMKDAGEISAEIRITDLARKLAERMAQAAEADRSIRPVTWRYLRNMLCSWGLWPIFASNR